MSGVFWCKMPQRLLVEFMKWRARHSFGFYPTCKKKNSSNFFRKKEAWCKKTNVFLTEIKWHQWNQIKKNHGE